MSSSDSPATVDLGPEEHALIESAERLLVHRHDNYNHTVAAAARDADGRTHAAVNVNHFTGGPCAELVTIGVAASSTTSPLRLMVAVGDGDRGVIAPCGRCRQVMFDYFPAIDVIVPSPDGPRRVRIADLLPGAYVAGGRGDSDR